MSMSSDTPGRFDHFLHAESLSTPQIANHPVISFQRIQGKQVGIRQVGNMDIVPDASPVSGRVIVAEDFDRRTPPERYVKHQRNEVGFRFMGFTPADSVTAFRRACHVKVAQGCIANAVNLVHPAENLLREKL